MSSALARLALAAAVAFGTIVYGHAVLADAAGIQNLLAGQLVASAPPALLGPITSAGRVGWACKPERMAVTQKWRDAALPTQPDAP